MEAVKIENLPTEENEIVSPSSEARLTPEKLKKKKIEKSTAKKALKIGDSNPPSLKKKCTKKRLIAISITLGLLMTGLLLFFLIPRNQYEIKVYEKGNFGSGVDHFDYAKSNVTIPTGETFVVHFMSLSESAKNLRRILGQNDEIQAENCLNIELPTIGGTFSTCDDNGPMSLEMDMEALLESAEEEARRLSEQDGTENQDKVSIEDIKEILNEEGLNFVDLQESETVSIPLEALGYQKDENFQPISFKVDPPPEVKDVSTSSETSQRNLRWRKIRRAVSRPIKRVARRAIKVGKVAAPVIGAAIGFKICGPPCACKGFSIGSAASSILNTCVTNSGKLKCNPNTAIKEGTMMIGGTAVKSTPKVASLVAKICKG